MTDNRLQRLFFYTEQKYGDTHFVNSSKARFSRLDFPHHDHFDHAATSRARLEVLKKDTDFKLLDQALIEAKNDPSEVRAMGLMMKRAQGVKYIDQALAAWALGDQELFNLKIIALQIENLIQLKKLSTAQRTQFLDQIIQAEQRLARAELTFSNTLLFPGLGLSISMGIIKAHGGDLTIDNHSPNTCFKIRLPK